MEKRTQPARISRLGRRTGVLAASALVLALLLTSAAAAQEGTANQAGLVIQFGDGRVYTACVDLGPAGQATGEQVLRAAGLATIVDYGSGMGGTLCKIGNEGCDYPAVPCFCRCTLKPGDPCVYWSYFHLLDGQWRYATQGASSYVVRPGDVEGWAWGPGAAGGGIQPPLIPFAQICSAPSPGVGPGATWTPFPTATATAAKSTATPVPTVRPLLSPTTTPTARTRTPSPTPTPPPPVTRHPPLATRHSLVERAVPAPPTLAQAVPTATVSMAQQPSASASSTLTSPGQAAPGASRGTSSYVFFGALVVALLAGLILLRIRQS
jgi:hypothetical protein